MRSDLVKIRVLGEAETKSGLVRAEHHGRYACQSTYHVTVNGVDKHDASSAEDVIRILCHYLHGANTAK